MTLEISESPSVESDSISAILEEGGVWIDKPDPPERIPTNLDYNTLESLGIRANSVRLIIESFVDFLNMPLVIDKFYDDHVSRDKWLKEIGIRTGGQVAWKIMKNNKLAVSKCGTVWSRLEFLFSQAQRNNIAVDNPLLIAIGNMMRRLGGTERYADLEFKKKLDYVHCAESVIKDFFKILETK